MADKEAPAKKLSKYVPLRETQEGASFPPRATRTVSAMDAADLAEGKTPGQSNKKLINDMLNSRDLAFEPDFDVGLSAAADRKLQKASELADQYKRETRGVKDSSLRGKLREATGMKNGGKVSGASKRADGIAQRGKTRGKMC
jgi:hypothetical protein